MSMTSQLTVLCPDEMQAGDFTNTTEANVLIKFFLTKAGRDSVFRALVLNYVPKKMVYMGASFFKNIFY